jgi:hypothetical protein
MGSVAARQQIREDAAEVDPAANGCACVLNSDWTFFFILAL